MEFLKLLGIKILVLCGNALEYCRVVWRYYGNKGFRRCDRTLLRQYWFRNPFRICRQYLEKIGFEDPYLYGETPLTSLEYISQVCELNSKDVVFELGCGRGRSSFWLHYFVGCQVVGIEIVPTFVEIAEKVQKKLAINHMEFRCADILDSDLAGATVLYLYGTSYDEQFILRFIDMLAKLPKGTKIITVSYSLNEYSSRPLFKVKECFPVKFTWGEADVYLHVRI
jgi:SAM-dependent methyltransferase